MENYTIEKTTETFINGIKIDNQIFDKNKSWYRVIKREEVINNLIECISNCKSEPDIIFMKKSLKYLLNHDDEFIFYYIGSPTYLLKSDNKKDFNLLCKVLLKLNGTRFIKLSAVYKAIKEAGFEDSDTIKSLCRKNKLKINDKDIYLP